MRAIMPQVPGSWFRATAATILATVCGGAAATGPAADGAAADERLLCRLSAYVVQETEHAQVADELALYTSREAMRDPTSAPGSISVLDFERRTMLDPSQAPSSLADLRRMASQGKVTAHYVFGWLSEAGPSPVSYSTSPERFTVVAVLRFEKGILVEKALSLPDEPLDCPDESAGQVEPAADGS